MAMLQVKDFKVGDKAFVPEEDRNGRFTGNIKEHTVIGVGRKYLRTQIGPHRWEYRWESMGHDHLSEVSDIGGCLWLFRSRQDAEDCVKRTRLIMSIRSACQTDKLKVCSLSELETIDKILNRKGENT